MISVKLISINIGERRIQQNKGREEVTGIYKIPTDGPVQITSLGIMGDFIESKKHHGGPDQALYIYGVDDYRWWESELGRSLDAGTFGENLTVAGLTSSSFNIGDTLHIGNVTLQVTAPRIPCGTFAARMGDPQWVKKFRAAEKPGLYVRVLCEGTISAGDEVRFEPYSGATISLIQMYRDYYDKPKSEETLRQHLKAPIAIRARVDLEKELDELYKLKE